MRARIVLLAVPSALAVGCAATAETRQETALPRVRVLATGGTIAGAQASATAYGYKSGAYDVGTLLAAVPHLDRLARISGEQVANIGSQDMNDAVWLQLAKRLGEVLAQDDTDAVLITHGTDTLEETSYFLSLVTRSPKPVVMVGSMRPATAVGADGPANLYNGVAAAVEKGARGLVVAGVGDGNMTAPALDALKRAIQKGVVVVRSTRLPMGLVLRNNEVDDDEVGTIASDELNPPKSRVLLQLALTRTRDPARIQQMFYEY